MDKRLRNRFSTENTLKAFTTIFFFWNTDNAKYLLILIAQFTLLKKHLW